ncbi:MAG: family 43 glycosylhydrolase, partial [Limisphaerales bacterium]
MRRFVCQLLLLLCFFSEAAGAVFYNPILSNGADPWILRKDGFYYYTHTTGSNVRLRKAPYLTGTNGIANAFSYVVFTPAPPYNQNVWAPELHFLQGKWYIYFAADDGTNANHRMFVAEADAADPITAFTPKGKIADSTNRWAIDGTVLEKEDGSLYFIWSGWPGNVDGLQNLYIAPMSNPWTISGPRVLISTPNHGWEGWINEGPQVLKRNGKIFIVYSANASWTDDYCYGLLTNTDGDVLNPASWSKHPQPVFKKYSGNEGSVFGPGHGSFTTSIDGTEDWMLYHAAKFSGSGWNRNIRLQRFSWNPNDSPNFGHPIPTNTALYVPSGEGANTLTVHSTLGGIVTRSPDQSTYPQNATVTLTATAAPGFLFFGWKGAVETTTNPLVLTMVSNTVLTAVFTNELILDNAEAQFAGDWSTGVSSLDKFGVDYRFARVSNTVTHTATYIPNIPVTANYDVFAWYPQGGN